ncbi:MAG: enoyl-CoA hydratase-related protein [Dehalococcoidia bacterium]
MPEYKNVLFETKGHLVYITINRPERRNAIDPATSADMKAAFEAFKADDDLWVAILTGAGDQAFSAGADLVAMSQALSGGGGDSGVMNVPFGGITRGFECWKPIIAAIHGYCLAGGLEVALSCDIRIAADNSQFGLPEPKRAIIPGATGTQRLPRAVPLAFAMELLLTGDRYDAETALRFGLVSRVVPRDQLMATAEEIATKILENGPLAVRAIKQAAMEGRDMPFKEGMALESQLAGKIFRTKDALEGPTAFAQKRKPEYKGQ